MAKSYYLDWCPRAVAGLDTQAYTLPLPREWRADLLKHNERLKFALPPDDLNIADVMGAYRLDGIFIFVITWNGDPPQWQQEVNISSVVSHYLKTILGHEHLYNRDRKSVVKNVELLQFIVHPVRLDERVLRTASAPVGQDTSAADRDISVADLVRLTSDPARLCTITSMVVVEHARPALLMLRARYSRLFDRTFRNIRGFKRFEIFGVRLYGDLLFKIILFFAICFSVAMHKAAGNLPDLPTIFVAGLVDTGATIVFLKAAYLAIASVLQRHGQHLRSRIDFIFTGTFQRAVWLMLSRFDGKRLWKKILVVLVAVGPFYLSTYGMYDFIPGTKWLKLAVANKIFGLAGELRGQIQISKAFLFPGPLFEYFLEIVLFSAIAFCIIVFTLDVSIKRRRSLRFLRNLRGHLLFGNVLNVVVENVTRTAGRHAASGTFNSAISIVDDFLSLEIRKRSQAFYYLIPISLLSIVYVLEKNVFSILTALKNF